MLVFLFMETQKNRTAIESASPDFLVSCFLFVMFLNRPKGATSLTDLLLKFVRSETKREGESDIKNNDLKCH